VIDAPAATPKQNVDPPVPEPGSRRRVSSDVVEQSRHQCSPRNVTTARTMEAEHAARSALAHLELASEEANGSAVGRGLHHFFETTAFNA
jgi:hypothetical protein